ncbi:helix-turn-helix transcriptional regulator [Escherichia albertii]|nr:helix-turn-helix transcriptional regulator [Escherichia albertii]
MQVFSSNVYFKIGIEEINSSQKEFFKDFIALVDLGHCFIIINGNQSKILYSYTDPVNIFLCNSFIRIPKNITTKDLISCFKTTNYREKQCYKPESLTRDEIDVLRLSVSYSLKQISIIKGIEYKTVSYHKIRALHKLNIKSIVELFISLSEWGKHYENIKSCMLENRNAINKIH